MKTGQFDLTGKVAIVTGGNGGIGLGMARGLAQAGAAIAIVGRNEAKSVAAVAELTRCGAKAISVIADVTDKAAVDAMVGAGRTRPRADRHPRQQCRHQYPQAAADARSRRMEQRDPDQPHQRLPVLAGGYPAMKQAGGGKIINIGSMMSIFGASFASAYAASKGGIVQFTRACAVAWAADNIQVNAVLPGWIDTDLTRGARAQIDGLHDKVLARTPAARWGVIDDFAGIAVFLASPASDFVTGTAIPVDGGFSVMG